MVEYSPLSICPPVSLKSNLTSFTHWLADRLLALPGPFHVKVMQYMSSAKKLSTAFSTLLIITKNSHLIHAGFYHLFMIKRIGTCIIMFIVMPFRSFGNYNRLLWLNLLLCIKLYHIISRHNRSKSCITFVIHLFL